MGTVLVFQPAPSRKEPYTAGAVIVGFKPSAGSPLAQLRLVKLKLHLLLKRAHVERPETEGDVQEAIRLFGKEYQDFLTDAECRKKWLKIARLVG